MDEDDRDNNKNDSWDEEVVGSPRMRPRKLIILGLFITAVIALLAFRVYEDVSLAAMIAIIAALVLLALGLNALLDRLENRKRPLLMGRGRARQAIPVVKEPETATARYRREIRTYLLILAPCLLLCFIVVAGGSPA